MTSMYKYVRLRKPKFVPLMQAVDRQEKAIDWDVFKTNARDSLEYDLDWWEDDVQQLQDVLSEFTTDVSYNLVALAEKSAAKGLQSWYSLRQRWYPITQHWQSATNQQLMNLKRPARISESKDMLEDLQIVFDEYFRLNESEYPEAMKKEAIMKCVLQSVDKDIRFDTAFNFESAEVQELIDKINYLALVNAEEKDRQVNNLEGERYEDELERLKAEIKYWEEAWSGSGWGNDGASSTGTTASTWQSQIPTEYPEATPGGDLNGMGEGFKGK